MAEANFLRARRRQARIGFQENNGSGQQSNDRAK